MEVIAQQTPVLVKEVFEALNVRPHKTYLDATCGSMGHARAILDADPTVKIVALDWDMKAIERAEPLLEQYGDRLRLVWGSFAHLYKLQKKHKLPAFDGILAHFGVSQSQMETGEGFSPFHDTLLDMRMSQGHFKTIAAHVVNYATEKELREIFWEYGEEARAKDIAAKIVEARARRKFKTTLQLAALIEETVGVRRESKVHPATKVFQALRIFVNKELDNIDAFLSIAFESLADEGRVVCISSNALEDRLVKDFCKTVEREGRATIISQRPVTPSKEELKSDPSSRSSKLRVLEKRRRVSV